MQASTQVLGEARMQALGKVAAEVVHDFNHTLHLILGHAHLARSLARDREVRRHIDEVMHGVALGRSVAERILDYSRGKPPARARLRVRASVERALALLAPSVPDGVRIVKALGAEGAKVIARASEVKEIVLNLCRNALEATPLGEVTVTLGEALVTVAREMTHGHVEPREYVRLAVSDTGCGMPPEVLARAFDPLFTTRSHGRGTGLGLPMVHALVAEMGGAIDVASVVGSGSTFTVWLPLAR